MFLVKLLIKIPLNLSYFPPPGGPPEGGASRGGGAKGILEIGAPGGTFLSCLNLFPIIN